MEMDKSEIVKISLQIRFYEFSSRVWFLPDAWS